MILFFLISFLHASFVVDSLNYQKKHGKYCRDITQAMVDGIPNKVESPPYRAIDRTDTFAAQAQATVLQKAVFLQKNRDNCFVHLFNWVSTSMDAKAPTAEGKNFMYQHVQAWLYQRKLGLINEKCESIYSAYSNTFIQTNRSEKDWVQAFDHQTYARDGSPRPAWKNYFKSEKERNDWFKICSNESTLRLMQQTHDLFYEAVGGLSDHNLVGFMNSQANHVIDMRTNKPITDERILNMDLRDVSSISLEENLILQNLAAKFKSGYRSIVEQKRNRIAEIDAIIGQQKQGLRARDFGSELQGYLSDQGTFDDALFKSEQTRLNLMTGEYEPTSTVGVCVKAQNHQTFQGELIEMGAGALVGGGVFVAGAKVLGYIKKLKSARTLYAATVGATVGQLPSDLSYILSSCVREDNNRIAPNLGRSSTFDSASAQFDSTGVPDDVRPRKFAFNPMLDAELQKHCSQEDAHFVRQKLNYSSCVGAALEAYLPLSISIPLSFSGL